MGMKGKHSKGLKGHPKTWRQEVAHNWPLYVLVLPSIILAVWHILLYPHGRPGDGVPEL